MRLRRWGGALCWFQDSTLSNHLKATHYYEIATNSISSLIAMNVVSYQKSPLIKTNLCEMVIVLSSSLLAMKIFFIAIFVSNRDKKERSSLISLATVGFEMNGFSSLFCR